MRMRSLTQLSRALSRKLVGGVLWSSNPSSSTVASVLGARDRHVPRARRGRGQHRSRGVSIHPGTAGVVGPRGGGEDPRSPASAPVAAPPLPGGSGGTAAASQLGK